MGLLMVESCLPEYKNTPVEQLCTQQVNTHAGLPTPGYSWVGGVGSGGGEGLLSSAYTKGDSCAGMFLHF